MKKTITMLIKEYQQSAQLLRVRRLQLDKQSKTLCDPLLLRDLQERINLLRQEETEIKEDIQSMEKYRFYGN